MIQPVLGMGKRIIGLVAIALTLGVAGCDYFAAVDPKAERLEKASEELIASQATRPAPAPGLTLEQAVDYALRNNLSIRAAELEYAIQHEVKTGAKLKMLPSLQTNLDYNSRNRYNASSSQSVHSGNESLEPSFSSERDTLRSDLTVTWNILDFGLSSLRARQAGERERMAEQNLRRLRQQTVMDTIIAYHRLRAAEEVMRVCADLESSIGAQREVIRGEAESRNLSRNDEAKRTMPLLQGLKTLQDLGKERQTARVQLAKAMGAPRPQDIVLADDPDWMYVTPVMPCPEQDMLRVALTSRPEMYNADSESRISQKDAEAALLQMAPNVNLSASLNNNPDRYLVYHNWMEAALRVSFDLLRLPAKYSDVKSARQKAELARMKRDVTAASVMIQVQLALVDFAEAAERLDLMDEIEATRKIIVQAVEDGIASGQGHAGDAVGEQMRYLSDFAGKCRARADLMAARARLCSALGLDVYGGGSGVAAPEPQFASATGIVTPELSPPVPADF